MDCFLVALTFEEKTVLNNKKFFTFICIWQVLLALPFAVTSCKVLAVEQLTAISTPLNPPVEALNTQSLPTATPPLRPMPAVSTQPIVQPAYLHQVLPDTTLAYLRLPSWWWPLGGVAIGSIFDQVVQSGPHAEAILAIRRGILNRLIPEVPVEWRGLTKFLLSQINSPLEIALLAPPKIQPLPIAMPELLITAGLNQNSITATNLLFKLLVAKTPGVEFPESLQEDGSGKLLIYGKPVEVFFDAAKQRLFLKIALPIPGTLPLIKQIAALQVAATHPLRMAENSIDATGQGLLFWFDPAAALRITEKFSLGADLSILRALGLADASSLALGMGGRDGKQHIKLVLDMPQVGIRNFLPIIHTDIQFTTATGLDTLLLFGLPSAEDLTRLETSLQPWIATEKFQSYQQQKAKLPEFLGLTAEQLFSTVGPELLAIHDQAGYYFALKLRDRSSYKILLQHLIQKFKLKYETRELLGTTFHHLAVPPLTDTTKSAASGTNAQGTADAIGWVQMLVDRTTHLYWIERQGYLVFADVPQVLMDILYSTPKVNVANWLHQEQGLNATSALFALSTRSANIPRLLYEMHLWSLAYWGDLTENPVDLFSLPSASELHLPDSGAYSIQFTSDTNQLAIEAVYESSPLEALMSVGFQALATAGILTSVAIQTLMPTNAEPQITQATVDYIQELQTQLDEFHGVMGRFPATDELAILLKNNPLPKDVDLTLAPDTGAVTLSLSSQCQASGGELILTPLFESGSLRWQCEGNLKAEQIPSELCPQ